MGQKFIARDRRECSNGAIAWAPGGPFDCLGHWAKVENCPVIVNGREVARRTCYATGYADTAFSIPACTRYKGKHVRGYFTSGDDGAPQFRVMNSHAHLFGDAPKV